MTKRALLAAVLAVSAGASAPALAADPAFISSVKIPVKEFERSVAFYAKALGAKATPQKANDWEWLLEPAQPGAGPGIVLFRDPTGQHGFKVGPAWVVVPVKDVRALAPTLKAAGASEVGQVIDVSKQYGYLVVVAKDPDGNIIEFAQKTK